mgnify:CR=1 FL=1
MNIGIDFNTKTTKAAILSNGSNVEDCKIFEVKNILVIAEFDDQGVKPLAYKGIVCS